MRLAAFLAAGLSSDPGVPPLDAFMAEVDRIILSGRQMPPAMLLDVARLPDVGKRMMALVYLRRTGLLTGPAVPLDGTVFLAEPAVAGIPAPSAEAADEN